MSGDSVDLTGSQMVSDDGADPVGVEHLVELPAPVFAKHVLEPLGQVIAIRTALFGCIGATFLVLLGNLSLFWLAGILLFCLGSADKILPLKVRLKGTYNGERQTVTCDCHLRRRLLKARNYFGAYFLVLMVFWGVYYFHSGFSGFGIVTVALLLTFYGTRACDRLVRSRWFDFIEKEQGLLQFEHDIGEIRKDAPKKIEPIER